MTTPPDRHSTTEPAPAPTQYTYPPPDRRHVLGPLTRPQLAVLAGALLVAVAGILRPHPNPAGLAAAVGLLSVAGALALGTIRGRLLLEWLPLVTRFGLDLVTGRTRWRSAAPTTGTTAPTDQHPAETPAATGSARAAPPGRPGRRDRREAARVRLPAELGALEVLGVDRPDGRGPIGVVADHTTGTYTAVLQLAPPPWLLEDLPTQQAAIARWGGVLARLAQTDTDLHRLQWVVRTSPGDSNQLLGHFTTARAPQQPDTSQLVRSYLSLLRTAGPAAADRTTLVAVQIAAGRLGRAIRHAGGGDHGAGLVLARVLDRVTDALTAAGLGIDRVCDRRGYQGLLRLAADPAATADLARHARLHPDQPWGSHSPWPVATEATWRTYRTAAAAWHRSFTLILPTSPVTAHWLVPLLLDTQTQQTIAMTFRGIPALTARRQVARDRANLYAELARRARLGQLDTAEDTRAAAAADQRMHELAEGHAVVVYAGTITVTAATVEALDQACDHTRHLAALVGCELQPLDAQQADGWTWTLPLARGLD